MERVTTLPIKLHHPFLGCRRRCCHRSLNASALKKLRWQVRAESVSPIVLDIHPGQLKIITGYEKQPLSFIFFLGVCILSHSLTDVTFNCFYCSHNFRCPRCLLSATRGSHIPIVFPHGQKRTGEGTCKKITCLNFPDGIPPRKQSSIIHNRHS